MSLTPYEKKFLIEVAKSGRLMVIERNLETFRYLCEVGLLENASWEWSGSTVGCRITPAGNIVVDLLKSIDK